MKRLFSLFTLVTMAACQKSSSPSGLPAQSYSNVSYGSDPQQIMDIYLPANRSSDSTPLLVMIHGGAWVAGDKTDFNGYVTVLKQKLPNYAIANINYRLATIFGNYFPTQENDVKAAINYLVQQKSNYQYSHKLALLGASAGGHLALLQAYKYGTPKVSAVVDFFGPTNMTELYNTANPSLKPSLQILMGGTPASNPTQYQQSSPVSFISSATPPTIVFHGTADTVVPVNQAYLLQTALNAAGVTNQVVIYPNLGHDFWPAATTNDAFDKTAAFLRTHVH